LKKGETTLNHPLLKEEIEKEEIFVLNFQ